MGLLNSLQSFFYSQFQEEFKRFRVTPITQADPGAVPTPIVSDGSSTLAVAPTAQADPGAVPTPNGSGRITQALSSSQGSVYRRSVRVRELSLTSPSNSQENSNTPQVSQHIQITPACLPSKK